MKIRGHPPTALQHSQTADEAQRLGMLSQLSQLHRQGVLTDGEFAAQKAQILSE